jgi:hypothetical protein
MSYKMSFDFSDLCVALDVFLDPGVTRHAILALPIFSGSTVINNVSSVFINSIVSATVFDVEGSPMRPPPTRELPIDFRVTRRRVVVFYLVSDVVKVVALD